MLPSRARWIAAAAVALCSAVVAVVLLAGGGDEGRVAGSAPGAVADRRDGPPPAPRDRPKPRRLTDAQVIERARKVTPWVLEGDTRRKLVALTFDDGPGPITPALQAELRRLRVPATFFQVAQMTGRSPDVARQEYRRPFAAGSHTLSHARLTELGPAGQRAEIGGGADAIVRNGGRYPRLFRPPYGAYDDATLRELKRRRMLMVLWSVTSRDWKVPEENAIAGRVIRQVRPGAIVLLHDFGGVTREPTLRALPRIVRALRRKGYRFVTVPRMLREAPPRRRPPRPPSPYPS